jgi:hypothetical protein
MMKEKFVKEVEDTRTAQRGAMVATVETFMANRSPDRKTMDAWRTFKAHVRAADVAEVNAYREVMS